MAIFESNLVQTTTITTAALVWDPTNTSPTTFGPRGAVNTSITPVQTLRDVTIVNTGVNTVWLGGSTVTAATGFPLLPGQQLVVNGYSSPAGATGTVGRIWGISTSGTTVEAGLATGNVID